MRKLAGGMAGAFALLAMMLLVPWGRLDCVPPSACGMSSDYGSWMIYGIAIAFYLLLPLAVVGSIQVAVLGIRDANRPHDIAVRAALGETQSSAVRAAARRGVRDGAIWVGGAYAIAGFIHVGILLTSGYPLTTESSLWFGRAIVGAVAVATLVLAHVIDTARPRRTPVERLFEEARPPESRRGPRIVGVVLGAVAACAAGVIIALALSHNLAPTFYVTNATGIAMIVAWLAVLCLALLVLIPWSRTLVPWWLGHVSRVASREVAPILEARAAQTSRASGRAVIVIGSLAFLFGVAAAADPSPSLSPTYVGNRVFYEPHDSAAFAARLREVDGVAGVVVAQVKNTMTADTVDAALFAVDPQQLRGLDDTLANILTEHPGAIVENLWGSSANLHLISETAYGFMPTGVVPIATCCDMFTSSTAGLAAVPTATAYLIYSSDPSLNAAVIDGAWELTPDGLDAEASQASGFTGHASTEWRSTLGSLGILVFFIGAPLVALAVGLARTRRSDDATLAALGATPRALRTATVLEAIGVAAFAALFGGGLGALTRASMTALGRARSSLTGVITDSYVATALGSVAWLALGIALVGTVALMGLTAWIAARRYRGETPVEGLIPETTGAVR